MTLESLTVHERSMTGKGFNRRLRAQGYVPGVFYNQQGANYLVKVEMNTFIKAKRKFGETQVFNLEIERDGKTETHPCLIWRVKYDPVKSVPAHIDFFGVDMDKEVKVKVPMVVTGRCKGVALGGKLEVYREIAVVTGKPMALPQKLVIDVTELNMGANVYIADVQLPEGVKALYDQNFKVLSVIAKGAAEEGEEA